MEIPGVTVLNLPKLTPTKLLIISPWWGPLASHIYRQFSTPVVQVSGYVHAALCVSSVRLKGCAWQRLTPKMSPRTPQTKAYSLGQVLMVRKKNLCIPDLSGWSGTWLHLIDFPLKDKQESLRIRSQIGNPKVKKRHSTLLILTCLNVSSSHKIFKCYIWGGCRVCPER